MDCEYDANDLADEVGTSGAAAALASGWGSLPPAAAAAATAAGGTGPALQASFQDRWQLAAARERLLLQGHGSSSAIAISGTPLAQQEQLQQGPQMTAGPAGHIPPHLMKTSCYR